MEVIDQTTGRDTRVKILILEDNPLVAAFYRNALAPTTTKCFQLLFAATIRDAILKIDAEEEMGHGVGFCIVDWQLPDGVASTFLSHLKAKEYSAKALVITGRNDKAILEECQALGNVAAFMVKPISKATLVKAFHKYICPLSSNYTGEEHCMEFQTKRVSLFGMERGGPGSIGEK